MRLPFNFIAPLLALALAAVVHAKSSSGSSVLVVLEPELDKKQFSTFFDGLRDRGYELTYRAPKDVTPPIIEDDVPGFAHVILFTPTAKSYAKDITPQSLVALLSANVNLLIALSPAQTPLSSLAAEFSLVLPPPHTPLLSYHPARKPPYTTVPVPVPPPAAPAAPHAVLSRDIAAPVLFAGVPHALGGSPFLVPILRAPAESFAAEAEDDAGADALVDAAEKGGEGLWAGSQMGLVTGFQARGGARVLWVGGVDVFSDEFAKREVEKGVKSGNAQFCAEVAAWTFQESLVLRIDNTTHHRVNETHTPDFYTINDQIVYTAFISKYDPTTSAWQPYAGVADMQLEFTMLDPHVRTALAPVPGSPGKYAVTFRAPDRHGVFKFVVDYKRKGWTHLYSATTVPVVPPRHDGYPRFLSAAWPYYTGAISTSVGFVLFCALWLAGDVSERDKKKGKKTE